VKLTTTIFCFLFGFNLFGQFQLPFPDDSVNMSFWTQHRYTPPDPADPQQIPIANYYYMYLNMGTDSIDGNLYHRLFTDFSIGCIGHYRVDGNKVYYRSDYAEEQNSNDEHGVYPASEYVLYDFDLIVGDTFQLTPSYDIILANIDSIMINGIYYRKFNFDTPVVANLPFDYHWIEGIGSSIGFYPYFYYFEDFLYFKCFLQNGEDYFTNGIDCFNGNAGVVEFNASSKQIIRISDYLGRVVPDSPNVLLIYTYDDGSTRRVFRIE